MVRRNRAAVPGPRLPDRWKRFSARYAPVALAYDDLAEVCRRAGPLDDRVVALAKLAVSVGGHIERTVHMHAKKALRAGVSPDALRQVALIAMPTIGLPRALDALRWIDESVEEVRSESHRRAAYVRHAEELTDGPSRACHDTPAAQHVHKVTAGGTGS